MNNPTQVARDYVRKLADAYEVPELQALYKEIRDLHDRKLWHQLTLKVEKLVEHPHFDKGNELILLYMHFIKEWETRINQLKLVKILFGIIRGIPDPAESIKFLQETADRLSPSTDKEAYVLCTSEIAFLSLKLNKLDDAKQRLEKAQTLLEDSIGADSSVFSSVYRGWAVYHKLRVNSTEFYKTSLMYLAYTPLETIPLQEQQQIAFDMALASLVSKEIYNFGELLAHPILATLAGTSQAWLKELLYVFNAGRITAFYEMKDKHAAGFNSQAVLQANISTLNEKIRILGLMELAFAGTAGERALTFEKIAKATLLPLEEVELLVMKALSLKLIRGSIDQVKSVVTITWVQPRILDLEQIGKMKDRVDKWSKGVKDILTFVQNETAPELLS